MTRPAETAGVAGAIALLIGHLLGVKDPATLTSLGVVVGFVPAAITWCVLRFGKAPQSVTGAPGKP